MAMSPEKRAAYDKLEEAVQELIVVNHSFDRGEVLVGYTVVVVGHRQMSEEYDEDFEPGDEVESVSRQTAYHREGQMPTMTRGMVENYLDRFRSLNF